MQDLIAGQEYTIGQLEDANARNGGHFFDAGTMRSFKSRISEIVHTGPEVWLIVTSERYDREPRGYTVRVVHTDGAVLKLSRFQQFATSRQAHAWAEYKVKELWKDVSQGAS